tara:strand:- start:201 stop:332 length:132 start_codon:yes stop_codon:yes gene_type:complete
MFRKIIQDINLMKKDKIKIYNNNKSNNDDKEEDIFEYFNFLSI